MIGNKKSKILTILALLGLALIIFCSRMQDETVAVKTRWSSFRHDKWIIVTTINPPKEEIRVFNKIAGWQLLVIGDKKTPPDWRLNGSIYLSLEDQHLLPYKSTKWLTENSYPRKNIGYLFAIEHGARCIYETDDDNMMLDLTIFPVKLEENLGSGLTPVTHAKVVNPYAHFGQSTIWPRGLPFESLLSNHETHYYKLAEDQMIPSIQQGLVNGDPDMDAIFRLTRKPLSTLINITFDSASPNLVYPANVYAPFNAQNTMFLYEAFWALLLPVSVTIRETDIFRSYWAKKLLDLTNTRLAFLPPRTVQKRNPHSYIWDFKKELRLYLHIERLIDFLENWNCPPDLEFLDCVQQLTFDMVSADFYEKSDMYLIQAWLVDLKSFGYIPPKRHDHNDVDAPHNISAPSLQMSNHTGVTAIVYYPVEQATTYVHTENLITSKGTTNVDLVVSYIDSKCGSDFAYKFHRNAQQVLHKREVEISPMDMHGTLLIIQLAEVTLYNILYYESLYKLRFLSSIIYCGKDEMSDAVSKQMKVSYIRVGLLNPISCLLHASLLGYNVEKYIYISSDKGLINVFDTITLVHNHIVESSALSLFGVVDNGSSNHSVLISSCKVISEFINPNVQPIENDSTCSLIDKRKLEQLISERVDTIDIVVVASKYFLQENFEDLKTCWPKLMNHCLFKYLSGVYEVQRYGFRNDFGKNGEEKHYCSMLNQ